MRTELLCLRLTRRVGPDAPDAELATRLGARCQARRRRLRSLCITRTTEPCVFHFRGVGGGRLTRTIPRQRGAQHSVLCVAISALSPTCRRSSPGTCRSRAFYCALRGEHTRGLCGGRASLSARQVCEFQPDTDGTPLIRQHNNTRERGRVGFTSRTCSLPCTPGGHPRLGAALALAPCSWRRGMGRNVGLKAVWCRCGIGGLPNAAGRSVQWARVPGEPRCQGTRHRERMVPTKIQPSRLRQICRKMACFVGGQKYLLRTPRRMATVKGPRGA